MCSAMVYIIDVIANKVPSISLPLGHCPVVNMGVSAPLIVIAVVIDEGHPPFEDIPGEYVVSGVF